jgi:hypothetical protein
MEYLKKIGEDVKGLMIDQWEMQGHVMPNSKFIEQLEYEITEEEGTIFIRWYGVDYAKYINRGVEAGNIPYRRGSGAKRSKYIQGLIKYVERRMGIGGREGVSIAFAIANKHKQEGMPTEASKKYSQTGKRTGWLDEAIDAGAEELDRIITRHAFDYVLNRMI